MSGEVDYRTFAGRPSPKPKYLSDSLVNYYGAWAATGGAPTILYSGLPTGDCIGKISKPVNSSDKMGFNFNNIQNLNNYVIDIWYKYSDANPYTYLYVIDSDVVSFALPRSYYLMNGAGAAPLVWTHNIIPFNLFTPSSNTVSLPLVGILARAVLLYVGVVVAANTLEIAGMTIRRLP
jgi:hypothetical protein